MLDFSQFNQLTSLDDLKSLRALKIIVLPEDFKAKISYKALLSTVTWSKIGSGIDVLRFFQRSILLLLQLRRFRHGRS